MRGVASKAPLSRFIVYLECECTIELRLMLKCDTVLYDLIQCYTFYIPFRASYPGYTTKKDHLPDFASGISC